MVELCRGVDSQLVCLLREGQFYALQEGTRKSPCGEGSRHHSRSLGIRLIERKRGPIQILTESLTMGLPVRAGDSDGSRFVF